jgi:hypothetical protein
MTTRFFTRFVAGPVAAASILGAAALGVAAGANAANSPAEHTHQPTSQHTLPDQRPTTPPHRTQAARPSGDPVVQHEQRQPKERQAKNG